MKWRQTRNRVRGKKREYENVEKIRRGKKNLNKKRDSMWEKEHWAKLGGGKKGKMIWCEEER